MSQRNKKPRKKAEPADNVETIHEGKTPVRVHYIPEWAELRGKIQADFVRAGLGDKGSVSKWFSGMLPVPETQAKIAAFLQLEDPRTLFRHPDDDWMARFMRRNREHAARIKTMLSAAFPDPTGTND